MAAFDTARTEAEIPATPRLTPDNGSNGHESSTETLTAEKIDQLRREIRQQLIIFTDEGRGRKLIDHGNVWRDAMAAINRLTLSTATDQQSMEALGDQAKAIFMEAWKTNPHLLAEQTARSLKSLVAQHPAALQIILEELRRIGKEDLAADFTESL